VGGAVALVLLAGPAAHADVWANVGPASSLSGLSSRWPLGSYALDEHFSAISAGVFSGVDVSGLLPMIAYFFANELWQLTAWLASLLVELFAFAFSLDLVNGSSATDGAGALGPVSRAIQSIYADVFGGPWMVLAVSIAGCWAMWKALVQRRYAETAGQLALSLFYVGVAFLFVLEPGQTIGTASHLTNEMSGAFLSIGKDGEPSSQAEAKEAGADQLFGLLVAQPWSVLEFGGLDHCVKAGSGEEPESVAVQPLPDGAARQLEAGEEVSAAGKTCVDNLRRYGPHFLRFEPDSKEREEEFDALEAGDSSRLPDADPAKKNGSYELGPADKPAAAAMEKGGQFQRLLVAIVVFCAEIGAFCLLGALSLGVITAQVLLLLLLAFSPVALVAAAIPGRGHQFFKGWLAKLAGFLLRKAAYSLVLAVLLAVCAAISAATSELGWLLSFGLQCAFFWAVFLQRRSLTDGLIGAVTGPGVPGRERALDAVALYIGARTGTRLARRPLRTAGSGLRRAVGRGGVSRDTTASTEAAGAVEGASPNTGRGPETKGLAGKAVRDGEVPTARAEGSSVARSGRSPAPEGSATVAPGSEGDGAEGQVEGRADLVGTEAATDLPRGVRGGGEEESRQGKGKAGPRAAKGGRMEPPRLASKKATSRKKGQEKSPSAPRKAPPARAVRRDRSGSADERRVDTEASDARRANGEGDRREPERPKGADPAGVQEKKRTPDDREERR
jgi:hypothetical protein